MPHTRGEVPVGVFGVRVVVFNLQDAGKVRELDLVVDTGATFPVIPRSLAEELGIRTVESRIFTLADGSSVTRDLGWAGFMFGDRASPSLVILGEERDVPILGALALEGLGLEADPVAKILRPATQYLLRHSDATHVVLAGTVLGDYVPPRPGSV